MRSLCCVLLLLTACARAPRVAQFQSWQKLANAPTVKGKQDDLYFLDEQEGWSVSGKGLLFHTRDGGASWEQLVSQPGTYFRAVLFLDAQRGFVGNIGAESFPGVTDDRPLFRTRDGGRTLTEVTEITGPRPRGICNFSQIDDRHLVATGRVGAPGFLLTSADGGETWRSRDVTALVPMLIDAHFVTPNDGYLVGGSSAGNDAHTIVLHTVDGGDHFTEVYRSARAGEMGWKFSFPSPNVGYVSVQAFAGGAGAVVKTNDGGKTWRELSVTRAPFEGLGIGFVSDKVGWLGGGKAGTPGFFTEDGGRHWTIDRSLGARVNRFRFVGHVGYAIGATIQRLAL